MILVFVLAALCTLADQVTKYIAAGTLSGGSGSVDVIGGVLRFTYVENRGAAFGSLTEHRWIFIVLSTVMILVLAVYAVVRRPKSRLLAVSLGLIIGGGIGNMIDRVALGYVIDFIDFCAFPSLWKWVFNGADSFVCVGVALLIIYMFISEGKAAKDETAGETASAENEGDGETDAH